MRSLDHSDSCQHSHFLLFRGRRDPVPKCKDHVVLPFLHRLQVVRDRVRVNPEPIRSFHLIVKIGRVQQ